MWIGGYRVRRTSFKITLREDTAEFNGKGWGHGVGMCQWGAYGMARNGKRCEEILKYYYPGAEISTIDKIKL